MTSIYQYQLTEMNGQELPLTAFQGKVLLIVNTASKCGLAPQLKELEMLHQKYHDQGLEIIGMPSNQFMQEFADDEKTHDYCKKHYGVTFLMTKKIYVNGKNTDPLFVYLKDASDKGRITWNYTKFLVDRKGNLVSRYAPKVKPMSFETDIVQTLKQK